MTDLHLDYETKSEIDLKKRGLDVYSSHPSTEVLMCSYAFDREPVKLWIAADGPMPDELREGIENPKIKKWAFNAAFERIISKRVLKLKVATKAWRCTKVLGHMQGFIGDLDIMGRLVGLPEDKQKISEGKRLIRLFCMPQKVSKNQPHLWRDEWTDPEDWALFCEYCIRDTEAERGIKRRLIKFPVPEQEWELYEIDQDVNDRGIPIDIPFCKNAIIMSARRKAELTAELLELTGLRNPNSPVQLTAWLQERGYPFDDIRKDTVKKVIAENADVAKVRLEIIDDEYWAPEEDGGGYLDSAAVAALRLRQQVARTSVKKYDAIMRLVGLDGILRNGFQFHGASRTGRDAGRGLNPQNLTRTPAELELSKEAIAGGVPADFLLELVTDLIREGDYEGLRLTVQEPLNALAGTVRSAVRAPDDEDIIAADLASIETCTIGWTSGCERLLNVFRHGKDAYKDFATTLYGVLYEDVSKKQRTDSKPAVLGAGFRLGGGSLIEGKRSGLWGYAEGMSINLTLEESHRAVKLFREGYPEIPQLWFALEKAVKNAMKTKRRTKPVIHIGNRKIVVPVVFEMMEPYMTIELPSGRRLYYHKPQMRKKLMRGRPTIEHPDGEPYYKDNFSYMGKSQNGQAWIRVMSHGGKLTENIVQAIARDILMEGMLRAARAGFRVFLRVHDELACLVKKTDKVHTVELLGQLMTDDIEWAEGMPLAAAGYRAQFYRKD